MDQKYWEDVEAILSAALEADPAERATILDAQCAGRPDLRTEVESLLGVHVAAGACLRPVTLTGAIGGLCARAMAASTFGDEGNPTQTPAVDRTGSTLSHYRLQELLGAGGMGVVYRARDTALGRDAAVKVLSSSVSAALRECLVREADASARLQHPAIATYFESGVDDGTVFLAMELVDGETLRQRLQRGALPVDEAVAITSCLLEALSHAHGAGILHRDIKPENIMLPRPGAAKLVDFGLARPVLTSARPAWAGTTQTDFGAIAGTIGYLSPEQIRREPLDVRSDIFQVGLVLYEMLSGTTACPGDSIGERLVAALSRDPVTLTIAGIPADLMAVLDCSIERDRSRRYPTAAAFLSDLTRVRAGEWAPSLPDTLAILDFRNLGSDRADDWIGTAFAESVTLQLAPTHGLSVLPRDRTIKAAASGKADDRSTAGAFGLSLGCRWVLTGTYLKQADALRVTMSLMASATGCAVAEQTLIGRIGDIFDLQDQVADIARASLRQMPGGPASARLGLSAYECYVRGRRLFTRLEKGTLDQAFAYFEEAATLEPTYAPVLTGLAGVSAMRFTYTTDPAALETAIGYARRAIAADPSLAEPHVWLQYALFRQGKLVEADRELRLVRELDPDCFLGYYFAASTHLLNPPDEGVTLAQRAVQLSPGDAPSWWSLGCLHSHGARYADALWCFEQADRLSGLRQGSTNADASGYAAECLRRMGRLAEAQACCIAGLDRIEQSDHMYRDTFRVVTLLTLGRIALDRADRDGARAAFRQAIAHVTGRTRTLGGGMLVVRALAGLACVDADVAAYDEACDRLQSRRDLDFSWLFECEEHVACRDLAAAARAVGRDDEARAFFARASALTDPTS